MSNKHGKQPGLRKSSTTEFKDVNGNTIWEVSTTEEIIKDQGSAIHQEIKGTIQTVDGVILPKDLASKAPTGVCQQCREGSFFHPKTHGIVTLKNAKPCVKCGTLCCPAHRKIGDEGEIHCLRHYQSHSIWSFLRPLFCKTEEE